MPHYTRIVLITLAALGLAACSDGGNVTADSAGPRLAESPPKVAVTEPGGGGSSHETLESRVDGEVISFEVYQPTTLEVGKTYPLVLHGHGYGGARSAAPEAGGPAAEGSFIRRLNDAGYYVISIDQRGFGDAGGTVRVMDPEFEGQDLIQILDWAEDLPGLRRRPNGEMYVGSFGGSYGGMYQFLLAGADPKQRLRVIAPDITPHDLVYALNPNNVIKSGWGLALSAGGEGATQLAGGNAGPILSKLTRPGPAQDPIIYETLVQAILTNSFSEASRNMFAYHSVKYFCDGTEPLPQDFVVAEGNALRNEAGELIVPPRPYARIDALVTQGVRDTLFNLNDGVHNYHCLKARGGDVRLLTHESGHILPVGLPAAAESGLDPFYQAITLQGFQDAGGSRNCGSIDLNDAQFAWFEEKLQGRGRADSVISTGNNVCLSLAEGDHIAVGDVTKGGTEFPLAIDTPQFSGALAVGGAMLGNGAREAMLATVKLHLGGPEGAAPAGGAVLAGIPLANLEFTGLSGAEPTECAVPLNVGACDPIVLIAIGHRKAGTERWDLVDDQLTAFRGFGTHAVEMTGVAERLAEGDELALLIYGFHAQFPVTWSRDVFVPALNISGSVSLPLL